MYKIGLATNIGDYAFYDCENLALTKLPNGITKIGESAFYQCSNLALTKLPDRVKQIGMYAFFGCSNLALTELPSEITSINAFTFGYCSKLALTEIPSGITSIGDYAFGYCRGGLTTLTFQGTPETISKTAFSNCDNLTTINAPWAEGAVANAPWGATKATINYNYVEK